MSKAIVINLKNALALVATYEDIHDEIEKAYGRNFLTVKQWEKKFPGLPAFTANGKLWQEWAMQKALRQCGITFDSKTVDELAGAMYHGDYQVATGGRPWDKMTKKEKSSNNFPYTTASKYMHRAESVVKFLEK